MRKAWLALLLVACSDNQDDGTADAGAGDGSVVPVWVVEPGIPTKDDLRSSWVCDANDIFAVGFSGTVIHYDGLAWNLETVTPTVPLTSVHGLEKDIFAEPPPAIGPVFAVGWEGKI